MYIISAIFEKEQSKVALYGNEYKLFSQIRNVRPPFKALSGIIADTEKIPYRFFLFHYHLGGE